MAEQKRVNALAKPKEGKDLSKIYEGDELAAIEAAREKAMEVLALRKTRVSKYPDELKIFAKTMSLKGYTYDQISDICQVGRTTVNDWINDPYIDEVCNGGLAEQVKSQMASDLLIKSQMAFNEAMKPERMEKSSTLQLASAGGIMFDKARLLKGESTQNVAMAHNKVGKYKDDLSEYEAQERKLEAEIAMLDRGDDIIDVDLDD